jgi:centrosomal protein CEP95
VFSLKIEEALRRHDLLTALVKKEYDHNKRLVCQEQTE